MLSEEELPRRFASARAFVPGGGAGFALDGAGVGGGGGAQLQQDVAMAGARPAGFAPPLSQLSQTSASGGFVRL
jgi:hypothetical protein